MNKKGKEAMPVIATVGIVVIALIAVVLGLWFLGVLEPGMGKIADDIPDKSTCPDDGDTSLKINVFNGLNDTATENFDVTGYLYQQEEGGTWSYVSSITDTTAPDATTYDCGYKYKFCAVASNADEGDHSVFTGVKSGAATIDSMGCAVFNMDKSNVNLNLEAEQHDVLTFRVFDNEDNRFAYDTGDIDSTTFEADGTTFSDGDNSTAFAVSSGGFLDMCVQMKGATVDEDFIDAYMLVVIEAPVDKWDEPTVKWNGALIRDVADSGLNAEESDQFSSYEYAYKIDDYIGDRINELCFYLPTCSGCDPSVDVEIDFAAAGNYLSVDGVNVLQGAAKDDSSNSVLFTVQDVTIDVS